MFCSPAIKSGIDSNTSFVSTKSKATSGKGLRVMSTAGTGHNAFSAAAAGAYSKPTKRG